MRVLVVGGGVAGLATAHGLIAAGHDVRVFERAEQLRATGGAVTLWSNGIGVLDAFGVDLDGAGRGIDAFEAWRADGRPIWNINVTQIRRRLGYGALTIPRYRLVERLGATLPEGVVELGREVTSIEADGDRVRVHFADGAAAAGDVLIGADGYRSVVRRLLIGDEAHPTGWVTWQGLFATDHPLAAGKVGVNVIGRGGVCGLLPAGEGLLQWWFEVRASSSGEIPIEPVEMLRKRFGSWRPPVPEILDQIAEADAFPHVRHRVPRVWGGLRSTLVGDAAHVMPPALARGANQSLEDAWVLAATLRSDDVTASLRRYEQLRRRRVAVVSRLAMLATTQQERPWTRVSRLPNRPVTLLYGSGLRAASTFLSTAPHRRGRPPARRNWV
jgi:FAD-dependent urate hydroxylase